MATILAGAVLAGVFLTAVKGECVDLAIISFGCSQETHTETELEVEEEVKTTLEFDNTGSIETRTLTDQHVEIHIMNRDADVDTIRADQTIDADLKFVSKVTAETAFDLSTVLKNDVDEKLKHLGPETQLFFEKRPGGLTIEKVRTALHSVIDSKTSVKNLNNIAQLVSFRQGVTFYIYAKHVRDIRVNQNIALKLFSRNLVEQVSTAAIDNETMKTLKRELELQQSGGRSTLATIGIVAGALAAVALAVYVWRRQSGTKKKTKGSKAAAAPPTVVVVNSSAAADRRRSRNSTRAEAEATTEDALERRREDLEDLNLDENDSSEE